MENIETVKEIVDSGLKSDSVESTIELQSYYEQMVRLVKLQLEANQLLMKLIDGTEYISREMTMIKEKIR